MYLTIQSKKFTFSSYLRPKMFVYFLHPSVTLVCGVKCKQTFLASNMKIRWIFCSVGWASFKKWSLALQCFKMVEETFFWTAVPVCTHQIFAHNPKSSLRFLSGRIQWIVRQLCSPEELSTSKYNGDPRDSGAEILGRERKPKKGNIIEILSVRFFAILNIISMHLNIR